MSVGEPWGLALAPLSRRSPEVAPGNGRRRRFLPLVPANKGIYVHKRVLMAVAASAVPVAIAASQLAAAASAPQPKPTGSAVRLATPLHLRYFQPKLSVSAIAGPTIPFYRASFRHNGKTYNYTSVGTNPRRSGATTTVPVTFVPVKIVESADNASTKPGTTVIQATTGSAIFHNSRATHGTQYGADTLRSSYWHFVRTHRRWHVRLGKPSKTSQKTVNVPSTQGIDARDHNGDRIMLVNVNWFANILGGISARYSAKRLVVFLTYDTMACEDFTDLSTCGIGGFHSAAVTRTGTHTFAWASWQRTGVFGPAGADVVAMSHETAEWLNNPFVNDRVPHWSVPSEPQYGCSPLFEVGDPLVGQVFKISTLHYQDEANFSWFARQRPSIGRNGWYSYRGTFRQFSPSC